MSEKHGAKYIAKSSAIASRMLGGEMMIMSAVDSTFFTLNPVASVIWQAADGCTPLPEIVARHVCPEFEVDPETAYRDVERFVAELSSYGILLVSETPFPASVFPCVQFPLPSGNVRRQKFIDIWRHSSELNDVRSIRAKDLTVCSTCSHVGTCTRCPGLAYMEGSMRGPSTADCEKSFHRTGIRSANMLRKDKNKDKDGSIIQLIQIQPAFA